MSNTEHPLVSVCMITYNHEKFILDAIKGVLKQEVVFPFELIICNDNSPDNTDEVLKDFFSKTNNDNIRYFCHENNLGAVPNFHFSFQKARGKYIAICEGDDFWIDSKKLHKQVNFLEANEDYAASFHEVEMLFRDKSITFSKYNRNEVKNPVKFQHVVSSDWLIPTCSFVFRKDKMVLPPFFNKFNYGDYPLFCSILINSKAYFFPEIMAIYRRNNIKSLTNTIRTFGFLSISADYIQLLTWLTKFANGPDKGFIDRRINKEVENIRKQVTVYKNSRFVKFYTALRKYF